MTSKNFKVKNGITIESLTNNQNELMIVNNLGELIPSGTLVNDITGTQTFSGGNGISIVENPQHSFTISVSGDYVTFDDIDAAYNMSNILIVDSGAVSGSGERGNFFAPYSNIHDAVEDSQAGDLIIVRPGTYYLKNQIGYGAISKANTHVHFMNTCTVYFGYTPFNVTPTQIGAGPGVFRCTGYAKFIAYSDGVFKRFVTISHANSSLSHEYYIDIISYDTNSLNVASDTGPLDENGNVISEFNENASIFMQNTSSNNNILFINVKDDYICLKQILNFQGTTGSPKFRLNVGGTISSNSEDNAFAVRGGTSDFNVTCNKITSSNTNSVVTSTATTNGTFVFNIRESITSGAGPIIRLGHGGTYNITANNITSSAGECVIMTSSANLTINNSKLNTSSISHNCVQRNTNSGSLTLRNCSITSSGTFGLAGTVSTSVILESVTLSNKPSNGNITTIGMNIIFDNGYYGPLTIKESLTVDEDVTITSLVGSTNEIVTLDSTGKLIASGSTIADISGGLNDRIEILEGNPIPDIFRAEVADISSGLDGRIDVLEQNPIPDIFRAEVADISSGLDGRITIIENDYVTSSDISDFITTSQVSSISANLQSQIDNISGSFATRIEEIAFKTINFTIDGGNSVPLSGSYSTIICPFDGEIVEWSIVADVSGSATLDIWKSNGIKPTNANSITASAKPSVIGDYATSLTLTGWSTSISIGDLLTIEVENIDTIRRILLQLKVEI